LLRKSHIHVEAGIDNDEEMAMRRLSQQRGRRLRIYATGLMVTAIGVTASNAAPSTIGQAHYDTATLIVRGTDGLTYTVNFELGATSGQPSQSAVLTVRYKACTKYGKCGFEYSYSLALSSTQATFPDANTAVVSARLADKPLTLRWTASPDPTSLGENVDLRPPDNMAASDPTSGGSAQLAATFLGITCSGNGQEVNEIGVFSAPQGAGQGSSFRMPKGLQPHGGHRPACQSGA
jgi:hypothetical protein